MHGQVSTRSKSLREIWSKWEHIFCDLPPHPPLSYWQNFMTQKNFVNSKYFFMKIFERLYVEKKNLKKIFLHNTPQMTRCYFNVRTCREISVLKRGYLNSILIWFSVSERYPPPLNIYVSLKISLKCNMHSHRLPSPLLLILWY